MKVPLSWLKEFVAIEMPIPELARRLTLAGLEVEEIRYVGLPLPTETASTHASRGRAVETNVSGLAWDPERIVVAEVLEVRPHPNADRLVLCRVNDGQGEHQVLTGAPNLFPYKGVGPLERPLKIAYAREGARLYDGHASGLKEFTLKKTKIRGVESSSMACSEKELGISDEHEGVILLDADAPVGMPLVEYMGDAVLDIAITPNIARDANILGVAREVAALSGASLREPDYRVDWGGPALAERVELEIRSPELNPRFVLGLVEGVRVAPSPYWVQRRLALAGMRPINNIVDATNYAMLEIGEPLHAFDFDVLVKRAGGKTPRIITRLPEPGERLTTLDGVERELGDFTVLVADQAGALSIAGVMGGLESEVGPETKRVLLEGAAWDFINIRRTVAAQNLASEASYRFERGVHPAMAERGVRRGLSLIHQLAGGVIAEGLVDEYPLPPEPMAVDISPADAKRWLGVELEAGEMADILARLEFDVRKKGGRLTVKPPDHRLDIGEGVVGMADLMEEIARIYGYDRIPTTMMADALPMPQRKTSLALEENVRDLLVNLGLQEVVTYRLTAPEREARLLPPGSPADERPYIRLQNPISSERVVMRHSLLASVLEVVERNVRQEPRQALFEIGPIFLEAEDGSEVQEPTRLALCLTGRREPPAWDEDDAAQFDFFDLKGILQALFDALHLTGVVYTPVDHPGFHPGRTAGVMLDGERVGVLGELDPRVAQHFEFGEAPVLAAEFDLDALLAAVPDRVEIRPIKTFPPVLEDLAVEVGEEIPAEQVEEVIRSAGGALLEDVRLFDLYRGEQIGPGKKSLAYALVFQAADRTLTDAEVAKVRARIIRRLKRDLGARLRA